MDFPRMEIIEQCNEEWLVYYQPDYETRIEVGTIHADGGLLQFFTFDEDIKLMAWQLIQIAEWMKEKEIELRKS
jgi:hypothetical protein